MAEFLQDVCYALRQMPKRRSFTLVAVLTLAVGIGANTRIFTLVNAVLLKSLPVPDPKQLFLVRMSDRLVDSTRFSDQLFQSMGATLPQSVSVAAMAWPSDFYTNFGNRQPAMIRGQLVSGNSFQTLETYPELGRLLTEEDDRVLGGSPVAVISYGGWQRRFRRDRNLIGRKSVPGRNPSRKRHALRLESSRPFEIGCRGDVALIGISRVGSAAGVASRACGSDRSFAG
jgi:hypothetical protein